MATLFDFVKDHQSAWLDEAQAQIADSETRRSKARYDTGTVSLAASIYLRGIAAFYKPGRIAEIGTFIGTSSLAMLSGAPTARIFTCDKSNDCGPKHSHISKYPYTESTAMLTAIKAHIVGGIDLFFIDGRLQPADLPLLLTLSNDRTVYAFDDYVGREKGVLNIERVHPWLHPKREYRLLPPPSDLVVLGKTTTIALLVPESRQ